MIGRISHADVTRARSPAVAGVMPGGALPPFLGSDAACISGLASYDGYGTLSVTLQSPEAA
jgi:hypothetical protein